MSNPQEYFVPAGYGETLLVERRSKFIGRVWAVEDEAAALGHIAGMREKHWDASHNVYAYIIRNGPTRYSDDGEPQGTSGMPTLKVFQAEGIFNVCCVVTRYFGGVLLGAGGLVRAYSAAAKAALDQAGVSVMRRWSAVLIPCAYAMFEPMKALIANAGGLVESADFGVDVLIEALVPADGTDAFMKDVLDMSSGRVEAEIVDTVFRAARVK